MEIRRAQEYAREEASDLRRIKGSLFSFKVFGPSPLDHLYSPYQSFVTYTSSYHLFSESFFVIIPVRT